MRIRVAGFAPMLPLSPALSVLRSGQPNRSQDPTTWNAGFGGQARSETNSLHCSIVIFASRTILPKRSRSFRINAENSAGDMTAGSKPCVLSLA